MTNYYNDIDSSALAWLRELMNQGHIPQGVIDGRSIKEIKPEDVTGEGQRHFFAGIGGWCEALRIAGWPASRSVWTGSCPCQPYSTAGKRKGNEDERDLWPDFFRLICKCRPDTIFGEQVEGAIRHGWLDRICADLEGEGYAVGHCVLGAHSVGSPHIRQRLYWLAHSKRSRVRSDGPRTTRTETGGMQGADRKRKRVRFDIGSMHPAELPAGFAAIVAKHGYWPGPCHDCHKPPGKCGCGYGSGSRLGHTGSTGSQERVSDGRVQRGAGCTPTRQATELSSHTCGLGNSNGSGPFTGDEPTKADGHGSTSEPTSGGPVGVVDTPRRGEAAAEQCGQRPVVEQAGYWSDYRVIQCRDGKSRRIPIEPEFFPLAHGVPGRVGLLRGYGNAIVPQVAAAFVTAFLESTE